MLHRLKSFGLLFLGATFFALLIRLFFLEVYRISSRSMVPTLYRGDLVVISKAAFNIRLPFSDYEVIKFKRPEPGEIVAFSVPDKGIETFVKRVIAVEGDRVQIKEGVLTINEILAPLEQAESSSEAKETLPNGKTHWVSLGNQKMKDFGPIDIPKNHFFSMGDNRNESVDSRSWGPVPYSCLKGRLGFIWLSVGKNGALRSNRTGIQVN